MQIVLTVIKGPHIGKAFTFDQHDHFFVGRAKFAHFRLPEKDPYFSRMHFMIEANPPACRLLDLGSTNGTMVNGTTVQTADLRHGDEIQGGDTVLRVTIRDEVRDKQRSTTLTLDPMSVPTPIFTQKPDKQASPRRGTLPGIDGVSDTTWSPPGYVFEGQLGSGGMGVVYRARRVTDGQIVAIKILRPKVVGNTADYQRFLREIDILRKLDHAAIVRLFNAGEHEGLLFFEMEMVDGDNAKVWADQQPGLLPIRVAIGIISRVLAALRHAHSLGFVHRDVKPGNILIQKIKRKLVVKLADFGLARAYQESKLSGLTLTGDICGTLKFMAPEQITDSRNVKPSSDLYAAAATLYWLLTKQHTHDFAEGLQRTLYQILLDDPVPIQERRNDVPCDLAKAIHRALAKDPEQRFESAMVFRETLRRSLKSDQ